VTLGADYFDELYARRDDPWRLAERWYERRKRALTLAMLPRERFASALEIGCSIGTLTAELAPRCDRILATDIAPRAVELARERAAGHPQVTLEVMDTPDEWPPGAFDLVMLSEVGYYLDEPALETLFEKSVASLADRGVIVACHWRHPVDDYPLRGDRVHEILDGMPGLERLARYRDDDLVLDLHGRPGAGSVAAAEGLA
jgi:SAM-dependent methyltransferase